MAFVMLLLVACIGFAVDYSSAVRTKSRMQAALDGAVLAAATAEAQASGAGDAVFSAFMQDATFAAKIPAGVSSSFQVDANGHVTGSATSAQPNSFMRLFGYETTPVGSTSKASYGADKAEIALVLDNTYSMTGGPLSTLKSSSKQLISMVYATPNADQKVKFAIVPFAQYVNVGMAYRNAPWISVPSDATMTDTECWNTWPNSTQTCTSSPTTCYADGVPYTCNTATCTGSTGAPVQECGPVWWSTAWYGCVGSRAYPLDTGTSGDFSAPVPGIMDVSCPAALTRLTNDQTALNAQIDAMVAIGETYIGPGLTWGWRVLSPTAPFGDGTDTTVNRDVKKYLILMTDGANTYAPDYPTHDSTDATLANNLTVETCNAIKANGVKIYVVALGISNPAATAVLDSCASGPPFYYSASTTNDLANAFASIGKSLTEVHLTQ